MQSCVCHSTVDVFVECLSRVRAALLRVSGGQVLTLSHKDVEFSQLLDVVDGEYDVSLNLQVPTVHGHHTSTQLEDRGFMQ